jgi:hypothetical protein
VIRVTASPTCPLERREEVNVIADAADDVVGLDGVPTGEGTAVVLGERVQSDPDQASVQLFHLAGPLPVLAGATAVPSSGKRDCHADRTGEGRKRSAQIRCRRFSLRYLARSTSV